MTGPFLPVGIQDFQQLRTGGFVYVDKTRFLHEMTAPSQGFYFLSRPRRFGKSLTVSTLKCLFEGRKELFDGLWISGKDRWKWEKHPVMVIDFNELDHRTPEMLERSLDTELARVAEASGIDLKDAPLPMRFVELIVSLFKKTERPVAVLVDEYDKPIISHLGKGPEDLAIAKENREILKIFFGVLKGTSVSPRLRFVFLTGVSKFSRVSIFSELNNLEDISMTEDHAAILGYTQAELETHFTPHLSAMAEKLELSKPALLEALAKYYNGYRFSRRNVRVYNPFSVLSALKQKALNNYWFETGTPTFLVNLIRERNWPPPKIEAMQATEIMFGTYDLDDLKPEALLFQTGYVTIKDVAGRLFTFDYPNREVKTAFLETLFHAYAEGAQERSRFVMLAEHLMAENLDAFFETVRAIYASIPYTLESKRDEAYFHTLFYLMVSASGANARSEVLTCEGRIDLMVEFSDKIFLIEFKCGQSADAALTQIREKGYADAFHGAGKKIILLGIDFDVEKRNVGEWKVAVTPVAGE